MKIKRTLNTIIALVILIILIFIIKYFRYEYDYELRTTYKSSTDIPGVGGILGILVVMLFIFYIIPQIWRKTKTEKIIANGKGNELDELFEAYKLNIFTKGEYELKKEELLEKINEIEIEEDYNRNEKERIQKAIKKLTELKNKKLITENEFNIKKEEIIPKKLTLDELNYLVESYEFDKVNTSEFLNQNFKPSTESLNYEDLFLIINNQQSFQIGRIFQVYCELKKEIKNTNANTVY